MQLTWQATLPGWDGVDERSYSRLTRVRLDASSWVDHCPGWLAGADELMADLVRTAGWTQRERRMYDAMVLEPRLVTGWRLGSIPAPVEALRADLSLRYSLVFDSVHVNLYRSGTDSVAWHGDTVRKVLRDPLVAIVSLGERRRFLLRPRGGRTAKTFYLGGGDLLVMGGAAQHEWEHSVPKAVAAGPRNERHLPPL